jgi:hypothetical protein
MRLLGQGTGLVCAIAVIAAGAWGAEAGGATSSSSKSATAGVEIGGSSARGSTKATTDISTSTTKGGELEKQAGKPVTGISNEGEQGLGRQFGHYFLSRWYDLIDIVDFSFGAGPGLMFNVHATKLAQAMGGWSDAYHVGFRGRSAGIWREKRKEVGVSLLYYQKVQRERVTGWVESFRTDKMDLDTSSVYANNADRSFMGVGAMIQAGVMLNVNVRPMQAADFVLGWLTIDVLEDDTGKPKRNKDL